MLGKSILIGLFVLKNNRRTKKSLGRVGKAIVPRCFFSGGYGRRREMEHFFAWAVTGGTGVNGLRSSVEVLLQNTSSDNFVQVHFLGKGLSSLASDQIK